MLLLQENPICCLRVYVGVRKQSVEDVDRLFSSSLITWMEKKVYTQEAEYLRVVHNWRRACDERGLSDAQRSQFNQEFLDYILDELMPYHRNEGLKDFSLLEVNRYNRFDLFTT